MLLHVVFSVQKNKNLFESIILKIKSTSFQTFLRFQRYSKYSPFPSVNNCYCCDCGMKWKGTLKKKHLSKEEFSSYLRDRGFRNDRDKILNERKIKKDLSEEKKYRKQKRIKVIQIFALVIFGVDLKKHKSGRK